MVSSKTDAPSEIVSLDDHRGRRKRSTPLEVLLVEDDDIDAELVAIALRKSAVFDIAVTKAVSIDEARKVLTGTHFDLVLLDYWLGPDTGLSIVEELGGRHGRIPVILLTGYSNQDIQQLGHRAGALSFLSKDDMTANTLDAVIRSTLHTHELESDLFATLTHRDQALRKKLDAFGQLRKQVAQPLQSISDATARIGQQALADGADKSHITDAALIQDNVRRVYNLVNEFIRQAEADQYRSELVFISTDVGELIGKALRLFSMETAAQTQSVDFVMPAKPVVARIDQTAMLQALLYVISSVCKHGACSGTLKLRALEESENAVVSVGYGYPGIAEAAPDPFRQSGLQFEPAEEDTSPGLPIACSILEQHGGRLELIGEPGRVTDIKLIFPLVR